MECSAAPGSTSVSRPSNIRRPVSRLLFSAACGSKRSERGRGREGGRRKVRRGPPPSLQCPGYTRLTLCTSTDLSPSATGCSLGGGGASAAAPPRRRRRVLTRESIPCPSLSGHWKHRSTWPALLSRRPPTAPSPGETGSPPRLRHQNHRGPGRPGEIPPPPLFYRLLGSRRLSLHL